MLISHRYKFIYLKARKVAGTSVESYLERYCVDPKIEPTYVMTHHTNYKSDKYGIIASRMHGKKNNTWFNHKTVPEIKSDLPKDIWDNYIKICNVRSPYDMMVSWYHYQTKSKGVNKRAFKQFVSNKFTTPLLIRNKKIWSDEGKYNFEYIRFENIEEDLNLLMEKLNLPKYDVEVPFFKKSIRGNWREYYDNESKNIVYNMFKDEIEFFNYKF